MLLFFLTVLNRFVVPLPDALVEDVAQNICVRHNRQCLKRRRRVAQQDGHHLAHFLRLTVHQHNRVVSILAHVRVIITCGVHDINEPSERRAENSQRPRPVVLLAHEERRHQRAETVCRCVWCILAFLLHRAERMKLLFHVAALPRIKRFHLLIAAFEQLCRQSARQRAVILPVIQRIKVRQRDRHVGGIIRHHRAYIIMRLGGMRHAPSLSLRLLRLIQGGKENGKERHVVRQRHASAKPVPFTQRPAQTAIPRPIPFLLTLVQRFQTGSDITKHVLYALSSNS